MNFDFDKNQSMGNTQKSQIAISLSQMEREDQAMLNRARYLASQITPDEAKEIKDLAEKNNITFELAKADKVRLKTDDMFKKMQDVRKQAPYFANLMGNETYASLTQDDIDNLMKIETNVVEKTWDVGRSLVAPIPDMAGGAIAGSFDLYALKQRFDSNKMQDQLAMLKSLGQENTRVYRFYEKLVQAQDSYTKFWNEYASTAKEAADNTLGAVSDFIRPEERRQNFATKTAEVVGQIGAQYAMGSAGLAVMGLNSISSQQEIMRENGVYGTTRGDAATLAAAGLEVLIERQQLGRYLNKTDLGLGLMRRLRRAGINAGLEGGEEGAQSVSTDIINKYLAGVEKDWGDIGNDALTAGVYGFAGAGVFSSLQGLIPSNRTQRKAERLHQERLNSGKKQNFISDIVDYGRAVFNKKAGVVGNEEFQKFEKDGVIDDLKVADGVIADFANQATGTLFQEPLVVVQGLTELGDIADASTTLKRTPEVFADTINKITAKTGSDIVYLNAADIRESFGENTGDLKAVLMQLDISEADFNVAVESGSDIKVKTGDYVAKISKDEQLYDLMNNIARLKEDAHSMRDIERLIKQTEQDVERFKNEPKTQLNPRETSVKEVYNAIFTALRGVKMDKTQADSVARIWAARANVATHGKDMLPMDWFKKATHGNLTINRNGLSAQIRPDGVIYDKIAKQEDALIKQIKDARKWLRMSERARHKTGQLDSRLDGKSLLEVISELGGLKDTGGELKGMDADKWHTEKPGRKRLISENGKNLDDMTLTLWEMGFFPNITERPEINDLLDLIHTELGGKKLYPTGKTDAKVEDMSEVAEAFDRMFDEMDTHLDWYRSDSNEVAAAIRRYQNELAEHNLSNRDINFQSDVYDVNGKADTNTEAFKKWFDDSKVIDGKGKPLVVYHGTNAGFDIFDKSRFMSKTGVSGLGAGFYFTDNLKRAERYAYGITGKGRGKGQNNVMEVYLNIKNPAYSSREFDPDIHDGIIETSKKTGEKTFLVLEPNQIKSVYNSGTWDTNNPNILYQPVDASVSLRQKVKVVDLTDTFKGVPAKAELEQKINELIKSAKPIPTKTLGKMIDFKADANRDMISHIVNVDYKKISKDDKTRHNIMVGSIEDLIKNAVFIEKEVNRKKAKKPNVDEYYRFYVPVKLRNKIYTVRLVAEKWKGEKQLRPDVSHLYDVIVENKTRNAPMVKDLSGSDADLNISLSQMLEGVKDFDGNAYLRQQNRASVEFWDDRTVINIFKSANKSSFIHETGHIFLRDMMQTAIDDPATNAQMDTLKRWMGAKDGIITQQMEEKFARAFEKYLMEGKAPSVELRSVFARFRQWLLEIYRNLFGVDRAAGQTINLTPEIRVLFDTLLATDQQIKEARRMNAQDELLPQDYFQSKEEYQVYLENLQKANDDAFDEVVQRRARAITRMREKEYVKEFRGELENAKKEVAQMPTYQLIKALKEGTLKFNSELAQAYGHPIDKMWLDENGHAPEDIAQDFGYSSADAMLSEISTAKDAETVAAQIATEAMMQRHDELFDELSIMDSAARSIYNQAHVENLIGEEIAIRGERNATKTKDVLMKAIEAGGNNIINNATLSDATNVRKYAKQAIKAGEDYEYALRNNIKHKALEAKHRQAMASYLVKRAYEAEEDIRKAENFFNEIKGREKIIGTKYFEQIKGLMAKHGYWDTDFVLETDFNSFANGLREAGEPVPVVNPVLFEKRHSNYWNMSYLDFMALYEGIKSIYDVGRNSQVMLKEGKKQEIKELAESLANNILAVTRPLGGKPVDPLKERSKWERFTDKLKDIESWLVKTEQIAIELDGGTQGSFYNEFYQRMSDAETKTALQLTEIDKQLADIFKDYDAARLDMRFQIGSRELTMKQILMLGLNWGNQGNRMAILNSPYGLNKFNVRQALAKLSKSDWETIQKVWDLMESYRDISFDLEERMTGVRPKAVVPEVVHTQHGDFRGGYFPIVFDREKSSVVEDREIRRGMEGMFENPQFRSITARGFLKARQGSVQPVLLNDLNVVKKHFTDLITDLNYREAKIDMIRLLKNEDLAAAIRSRLGKEGFSNIQKWVLDAGIRKIPLNAPDRIMDALRINAVKFSMAGNIKVMATQFSGLGATAAEVGGANTARWVGNYMSSLASKKYREYGEFILSRSKFMQLRAQELDRDLKDFYNKNLGKSKAGIMIDNKVEFLLAGIQKMDFLVSSISWRAGYEKAVLEGKTEQEAINYADSVVRLTQGSGRGVDQSRIQRENSMWKIMTSFYSVFNVMYNRYRRAIRDVQQGKGYSRLVREAAYTWLMQSFMEAIIRWLFDNDEKKKRGIPSHFAEQAISQIFSTNPLTFYMSNSIGKIASNQSVGIVDFTPHGFSALKSATQTIGAIAREDPDFGKAAKNAAVSLGQATGMISRSEINFMEALLHQIKEGYFNPMEYISGVQKK